MQSTVTGRFGRLRESMRRHDSDLPQVFLGIGALVVIVLMGIGTVHLFNSPPDTKTVRFLTDDAVAIPDGASVRVAGIAVGSVSGIKLHRDTVEVTARVKKNIRLGDATRVQVRLLTAVGGFTVNLIPGGTGDVGDEPIPVRRVDVPYTIADTLQAIPRITDNVEGVPIDEVLNQMSDGLQEQSRSIRKFVSGAQSVSTILDEQRTQVRSIMSMVSDYSSTFHAAQDFLFGIVTKAETALSAFYVYRAGFSEAYWQTGLVLLRLGQVSKFYLNHSGQVDAAIESVRSAAAELRDGMTVLIDQLRPVTEQLRTLVGMASGARDRSYVLDMSNVCIPVAGRIC